jgi:hypothetical protein
VRCLVDANVLSEATKPDPDPRVVDWLTRAERELVVDPIILGELRFGILLLPRGQRRSRLERWEADTGLRWAKLLADLRAAGKAMPIKDSLIAATALKHDLAIATLNLRDFAAAGVQLIDPARSS